MFDDLKDHTADVAMCSIWVTLFDDGYDVSTYYNHECNTLLIPKPKRLSEITAIYTTLSAEVWIIFALLFFAMGILLRSSPLIDTTKTVYGGMSDSFLDVMNVATTHGVPSFWKQQSSTKVLMTR